MPTHPDLELLHIARQLLHKAMPARHGPDFCSVVWAGEHYSFTPRQAAVVRILWEAFENDTPDVLQSTLLAEVGSECGRLQYLFKRHPAWGGLIVPSPGVKGAFRLKVSFESRENPHE